MNRSLNLVSVLLVAVAVLMGGGLVGCSAGEQARNAVVEQGLPTAVVGLMEDVRVGIDNLPPTEQPGATVDASTFESAILSEERDRVVAEAQPLWPSIESWALLGINAQLDGGDIGPNGADSLRERVNQFETALFKL